MFSLDRNSPVPLADQIEARLRALIKDGQLPAGAKLTSIRTLAAQLGVSPNTVVTAYDRLVAAALIDSRGTAGFFVCEVAGSVPLDALLEAGEEQDAIWLVQQSHDMRAGVLPVSSGALPVSWLEDAIPATVVQRGLARSGGGMASRCPTQGLPELRERLAMLMRGQGIAVDASRVMTTWGSTHAIDLICRAFLQPGDTVLVENPGYFLLFDRLRRAGVRMLPIARRPDGPDLAELEAACIEHRPKLLFIQSVLHNPTGWGSSAANLHRVLLLAERHGFLVAEDDVHGHFHPGQVTRLAQLSELRGVIYYSSFCKALSPALRLGYLAAAPALLKPLMREKIHSVMTIGALNEFVLLELLASGRFRKHIDRLQQRLATARGQASRLLRQAGILLDQPGEGGLFLWGAVPHGVDLELLVKDAYRNGILLARNAAFTADGSGLSHSRFNVIFSQHERLAQYLAPRLSALSSARTVLARASAAAK
ncbi:PLP-dependent aminotransferase family protein [Piscinibacter sp.]|uniref:aminotransferase-like domain-containing protein n=1 Tax=Piscinibacter sp. TaxID=1903157 RepID=UPI002C151676|nr:PLP-dependent aminotransferase family protein [Albitalea sp.]HUG21346.1 PLP-dependent aminotransferase family protein [Albitalea sp.]